MESCQPAMHFSQGLRISGTGGKAWCFDGFAGVGGIVRVNAKHQ
jgi:hypothetical protein